MSELFYVSPDQREALESGRAVLDESESRHLTRVLRRGVGDEATLFDGRGTAYRAVITSSVKTRTELEILESWQDDREPDLALTAIMALPKGDRQKIAIEKLVELGVRRVLPLAAERADVKVDDGVLTRLQRQVLEATKQCGRLRLMELLPAVAPAELPALTELLQTRLTPDAPALSAEAEALAARYDGMALFEEFSSADKVWRIVAHPKSDGDFGQQSWSELVHSQRSIPKGALLLIGPVGGFTNEEVASAVSGGWLPLDLGRQVYRVETAAIVASALLLHLS